MAYRTTAVQVQLLSDDFSDMTADQLEPHIASAHIVVTDQGIAADSATTSTKLELITRYLAAHFATVFVREATREKAGQVAVTYDGTAKSLGRIDSTRFGRNAIALDSTGALARLNVQTEKAQSASMKNLHKAPSTW